MTTNDVATREESSLTLLPPARTPIAAAKQMLLEHAEMMATAHQLASALCSTQMVPLRFRGKPDDGAAAILFGGEIGLNPIQSLQKVVPIHGMPSLEARTMVALLKSRGYRVRTSAQSDDSVTVTGVDLNGDVYESTWTIERARRAGYVPEIDPKTQKYKTNKNGNLLGNEKYLTDPQAMLKAKAQAEVCREMAPDVLMGISYTSEELESERWDDSALPPAPVEQRAAAPVTVDEILGEAPAEKPKRKPRAKAEPKPEPQDAEVVEDQPATTDTTHLSNQQETLAGVGDNNETDTAVADTPMDGSGQSPADAPTAALQKSMRAQLTGAIFSMLGDVDLAKDENREDRLIVIEAIVGRPVASSKELTDDELQNLRNSLHSRQQAGTLEADVNDWLNWAAVKKAEAAEADSESTTEGK